VEKAEAHYHQASALANGLGMRPLLAHCHLGLGRLYPRNRKAGVSTMEHLVTATTMMRGMEMGFWLQKAKAELAAAQ
jgi:hypothetical protein